MNPNQVNQFMGTTFTKQNYDPPTGMGRFDFEFSPALRQITVRVKAQYNFLVPAGTNTYLPWKESQKSDFKSKASKVIERAWSHRYKFVCSEANVAQRLNSIAVRVLFEEEANLASAHYRLDARKVGRDNQNSSELWAGGCNHGAGVTQYNANFSNWGVEKREMFGSSEIFNFKEQLVKERFAAMNIDTLPILHGTTKLILSASNATKLNTFAAQVRKILDTDVTGIQCRVYGCSTEKHLGVRAHARAAEVVKVLGSSIPNFYKADSSEAGKRMAQKILQAKGLQLGNFSGVVLYIHAPESQARRQVRTDYIVITHEFGHMLGCPDEYNAVQCTRTHAQMQLDELVPNVVRNAAAPVRNRNIDSTERQRGQQRAFIKLATNANVKTPAFFGSQTVGNEQEYQQQSQANQAQKDALAQQFHAVGGRSSDQYKQAVAQLPPVVDGKVIKSDSIMYTGQKVLPAHYLTIWACLAELTAAYVHPNEWSIQSL